MKEITIYLFLLNFLKKLMFIRCTLNLIKLLYTFRYKKNENK